MSTELLTLAAVCQELGVSRSTLDDWRRTGRGPVFKKLPNGSLRITREALDAWLATLAAV